MTRPAPADAHAILPLVVLEAIRSLDSPSDEEVAEYVDELLKKRFGTSSTVAAQIARYGAAARRDGSVRADELVQVLRLVGRRTDAALVFADSGRRAARRALARVAGTTLWAARHLPRPLGRAVGFRAARRVARGVLAVHLAREGVDGVAVTHQDITVQATPDGAACAFLAAAVGELLRQLLDFDGTMQHGRCRARGDAHCEWRTSPSLERHR